MASASLLQNMNVAANPALAQNVNVTPANPSANPAAPQPNVGQNPTLAQQQLAGHPAQYPGYNLANVDMTGFQGVDWGSLYGMGMYV